MRRAKSLRMAVADAAAEWSESKQHETDVTKP